MPERAIIGGKGRSYRSDVRDTTLQSQRDNDRCKRKHARRLGVCRNRIAFSRRIQSVKEYRAALDAPLQDVSLTERCAAMLARYEAMTGYRETNPNAAMHHRLSLYGSPALMRQAAANEGRHLGIDALVNLSRFRAAHIRPAIEWAAFVRVNPQMPTNSGSMGALTCSQQLRIIVVAEKLTFLRFADHP
jgi:hypothetical protein